MNHSQFKIYLLHIILSISKLNISPASLVNKNALNNNPCVMIIITKPPSVMAGIFPMNIKIFPKMEKTPIL